ncbi:hypothetical protein [Paeniglutamicibacter antarcticus]|uniref:Uncharacterized protein n=1 Tax=Paeniglutamicibacter antarcticus TaxID=494023 RepID=A0ABP9TNC8_9MICC
MSAVNHFKAKVGALSRSRADNDPDLIEARRNLKAARLTDQIRVALNTGPKLDAEQLKQLSTLLQGSAA